MHTKLTLRLDDRLISGAKQYAKGTGKSLSQIVSEYFEALLSPAPEHFTPTPAVSALRGILKQSDVGGKQDYYDYLEKRHSKTK
ncbi:MAG: DUF6364 family protein [Rhodospirillaceae bacterium]|nr:DUF6364 family protein [Rhodospirillaceae bacterium]MDE0361173.1 DUF6364 family protein [Rhodospirillaceae bacterium]